MKKKISKVSIRVNDDDLDQWKETCKRSQLRMSEVVRGAMRHLHRDGPEVANLLLRKPRN